MKAFGGYFGLELTAGKEYYNDAVRLNSGRNALLFILKNKNYSKIFVPHYACNAVYQPFQQQGIPYEEYHINEQLEPDLNFDILKDSEALLYINYFGIKDQFVEKLCHLKRNFIVDNCQAFFSPPTPSCDTFYSPRKFFGVPDGAYLYFSDGCHTYDLLSTDESFDRCMHLLIRHDHSPEKGYPFFVENEKRIDQLELKGMSKLTYRILDTIDYHKIYDIRRENYSLLHKEFTKFNDLSVPNIDSLNGAPLAYPLLIRGKNIREDLYKKRLFAACYWPDVLAKSEEGSLESSLAKYLIPLPVDQRYNKDDMRFMIDLVHRSL